MSHLSNSSPGEPHLGASPMDAAQPTIQHVGDSVTTGTIPVVVADEPDEPKRSRPVKQPLGLWIGVLGVITVLGGAAAGVLWWLVVPLTTYSVNADGGAVTTERGLANYVAGDAWFAGIGLLCGVGLGLLVWRWFGGVGWPVAVIGVAGASVMALSCWQMGWWLGPGPFEPRLAAATPGMVLPIELTVRAHAAILVWALGAVLPIMLLASLLRDPEERSRRTPRARRAAR